MKSNELDNNNDDFSVGDNTQQPPNPAAASAQGTGGGGQKFQGGVGFSNGNAKSARGQRAASAPVDTADWLDVHEASRRAGISVGELLRLRPLLTCKKEGRRVLMSLSSLFAAIQKKVGGAGKPAVVAPVAAPAPRIEALIVTNVPRNKHIVEAARSNGTVVRVRVSDNKNFLPGMTLTARQGHQFADVWNLEGRCPRYRGRW